MLLLLALALVWFLIINFWRIRRKAGRPLLDLGRPGRLAGYAGAMFSLLLAAVGVLIGPACRLSRAGCCTLASSCPWR